MLFDIREWVCSHCRPSISTEQNKPYYTSMMLLKWQQYSGTDFTVCLQETPVGAKAELNHTGFHIRSHQSY